MKGWVYKSTGSWYQVGTGEGEMFSARIKGKFKIDGITSTNPLAVGDVVDFEKEEDDDNTVVIHHIHERKNYITRQSPHNRHQHHIVAANLDQSLLLATLLEPKTSTGFIDRFLVASEAYHVPAIIVFNKTDLFGKKEEAKYEEIQHMYENAGYRVMRMSVANNTGIDAIKELLTGKTTLISGHSGVGKSSFINTILPELSIKTQLVSDWSGKGLHTTTFAEMYDLPQGGRIIDTPGMREFALMDIEPGELSHYFTEMKERLHGCKFNNCMHIEEPGCAIKKAVEEGAISPVRYVSYLNILSSIESKKW